MTPRATPPGARFARRRLSLQVKLVAVLLVAVLAPMLSAAYLVEQIGKVAANFAASEAEHRDAALARSAEAYRRYFATAHRLHGEVTERLARRLAPDDGDPAATLRALLAGEPDLVSLALRGPDGAPRGQADRPLPASDGTWQVATVTRPAPGGATLAAGFAVRAELKDELRALGELREQQRHVRQARSALPAGYRNTFLAVLGGAAVAAAVFGVVASRRVTRRIDALVATARAVAAGDGDARARLGGRDEMAELGSSLDTMLDGLDRQRREIEYLQRIGAWQDVARKLAHEIKNPLTPIQLAVQQCVSTYRGGDPKFARLLADTGEIVEEEIAGLRRLVDTFRTLGQLPRVDAHPVPLTELLDDLRLDPALAERVRIAHPGGDAPPPTVRADRLLLRRVLANLVENGVHAGVDAGRAGDVVVAWRRLEADDAVELTIDDEGRGVPPDQRERIFEPYVTTKPTGTGLGLAIAKKLTLEHGGTLEVADEPAPTGGARMRVRLPVASQAGEPGVAARAD